MSKDIFMLLKPCFFNPMSRCDMLRMDKRTSVRTPLEDTSLKAQKQSNFDGYCDQYHRNHRNKFEDKMWDDHFQWDSSSLSQLDGCINVVLAAGLLTRDYDGPYKGSASEAGWVYNALNSVYAATRGQHQAKQ
ncbi:hypothetical protein C8R44DRAFT_749627 [Mycena epipterygia]|nr:hypothetical protein C8R44DRAFT_749627 [Mycena epipterygia]